jgi:ABC-type sugar transport system ATPase subunit
MVDAGEQNGAREDKEIAPVICVEELSVRAGTFALDRISFAVAAGEYAVLMGRTGSGKTTILESLCGLKRIAGGRITLFDRDVTQLKPAARGIGYVPQDGALFPTMTVTDQLGFALAIRKANKAAVHQRVKELAELLGLEHLLHRRPEGLSGGERQRVALGRALAARPGVLCLDEPLSALDERSREEMYALLKSIRTHTRVTTLHITHSKVEAKQLADSVLLLEHGSVRRISLDELPANSELMTSPAVVRTPVDATLS